MTLGDVIEGVVGMFGGEPRKTRKLRERVAEVTNRIRGMEDGLRDVRKQVSALEELWADRKCDLEHETSVHNQDLIMDEMEGLEKEFTRKRELARLKGENVDAARVLRAKLEQLLEVAVNGGDTGELEDILIRVESMDADMSDLRKCIGELEKSSRFAQRGREEAGSKAHEEESRAARRARILGGHMGNSRKPASVYEEEGIASVGIEPHTAAGSSGAREAVVGHA